MGALKLLRPWLPHLAIAAALLAGVALIWRWGHEAGANAVQVRWDAEKLKQADAREALQAAHRAKEREWHEDVQVLSDRLAATQRESLQELDTTLADLRGDNLRLRQRFRACSERVPSDPEASSGDDGAGGGGLSEADQELALRIGADADRVVNKLAACQSYVREIARPHTR